MGKGAISKMQSAIKEMAGAINYHLFHNRVRPDINVLYALHHQLAKTARVAKRMKIAPEALEAGRRLREQGFCVLKSTLADSEVNRIAAKADTLLTSSHLNVTPATALSPLSFVRNSLHLCPEIEAFLEDRLIEVLPGFFGSEAQLIRTELYRLYSATTEPGDSWLWHFDNAPAQIVKAMVYLTDTWEHTGAFRLIPRRKSRELQRRGFWDRNQFGALAAELNDSRNSIVVEGKAGTIVLFSGHYCIHKATVPRRDFRDVVVFTFQPSFKFLRDQLQTARTTGDVTWAYHRNPFTGKPMKSSD